MEEWKEIPGLDGYEASNLGRIRSLNRSTPRILSLYTNKRGYQQFSACVGTLATKQRVSVHRAVYSAYVRPLNKGEQLDHIDRNPSNNRVENLRIATVSQNAINAIYKNTRKYKGVTKLKHGVYRASLMCNRVRRVFGNYNTAEESAIVYNHYARKLFGAYAVLNAVDSNIRFEDINKISRRKYDLPKGVTKSHNKYSAVVWDGIKQIHLGSYATPEEAALAYNQKAHDLYGDEANLNDIDFETLWAALRKKFDRERNKLPKGISSTGKRYRWTIHYRKKRYAAGSFKTPEEAVEARNLKLQSLQGGN